ncbi:MAG TPA: molybdenum cofactor biosynthesis protein MoaE [Capsulimonadaceae bacterium]|nr:molybdenum cofactor biosynthesis protein MoaE [Capsulimonadaceae bacterium]
MAYAAITDQPIDIGKLEESVRSHGFGGYVTFSGNVRDNARGKKVLALSYDSYRPLAQKQMLEIAEEVERKWGGSCAIAHRIGPIPMGESSVAIVVGTAHRAEAFEACRWAIDTLKETVPIWKRETYEDGEVWIEGDAAVPAQGRS